MDLRDEVVRLQTQLEVTIRSWREVLDPIEILTMIRVRDQGSSEMIGWPMVFTGGDSDHRRVQSNPGPNPNSNPNPIQP